MKEEIKALKKHYGFSDACIKKLKKEGKLEEVIRRIKMEHFSLCKGVKQMEKWVKKKIKKLKKQYKALLELEKIYLKTRKKEYKVIIGSRFNNEITSDYRKMTDIEVSELKDFYKYLDIPLTMETQP